MTELQLGTIIACACLFAWGGYSFLAARRFILPCVLGVAVSSISGVWWLGLTVLPVMVTLSLAYKHFGMGNLGRAIWLMLQAVVIGLGPHLTHHLELYFYIPYFVIAAVLAGFLNNRVNQIIGDLAFGGWLAFVVFLIHS